MLANDLVYHSELSGRTKAEGLKYTPMGYMLTQCESGFGNSMEVVSRSVSAVRRAATIGLHESTRAVLRPVSHEAREALEYLGLISAISEEESVRQWSNTTSL